MSEAKNRQKHHDKFVNFSCLNRKIAKGVKFVIPVCLKGKIVNLATLKRKIIKFETGEENRRNCCSVSVGVPDLSP